MHNEFLFNLIMCSSMRSSFAGLSRQKRTQTCHGQNYSNFSETEEEIKNQWHTLFTSENIRNKKRHVRSLQKERKFFESMSLFCAAVKLTTLKVLAMIMLRENPILLVHEKEKKINETSDVVKAELYKSCIKALKLNSNEKLKEDDTFGKTMADTLSRFTDLQKAIAKKKIDDVLFELAVGALNNHEAIHHPQYYELLSCTIYCFNPQFFTLQISVYK